MTSDKQPANDHLTKLRQLAQTRGYEPVVYEEVESAARARHIFNRMLVDARAGRVCAILVWALDRFHRSMLGPI